MPYVFARHKVADYKAWKKVFDSFKETRKKGGEKSYHIFHSQDDPNDLHMMFEWESFEKAESFLDSDELKDAMEEGGVLEQPFIEFTDKYESGTP